MTSSWEARVAGRLRALSLGTPPAEVAALLWGEALPGWEALPPDVRGAYAPWVWEQVDRACGVLSDQSAPRVAHPPAWDEGAGRVLVRVPHELGSDRHAPYPVEVEALWTHGLLRRRHLPFLGRFPSGLPGAFLQDLSGQRWVCARLEDAEPGSPYRQVTVWAQVSFPIQEDAATEGVKARWCRAWWQEGWAWHMRGRDVFVLHRAADPPPEFSAAESQRFRWGPRSLDPARCAALGYPLEHLVPWGPQRYLRIEAGPQPPEVHWYDTF